MYIRLSNINNETVELKFYIMIILYRERYTHRYIFIYLYIFTYLYLYILICIYVYTEGALYAKHIYIKCYTSSLSTK